MQSLQENIILRLVSKQNSKTTSLLKVTEFELNPKYFPILSKTTLYFSKKVLKCYTQSIPIYIYRNVHRTEAWFCSCCNSVDGWEKLLYIQIVLINQQKYKCSIRIKTEKRKKAMSQIYFKRSCKFHLFKFTTVFF